jgi:hypothetical protein
MASKADYYASLSRAVAALDRDSYAARGAIYDREHKALLRRLFTADPPHSDEEIEREQQAFRTAIRRIEFGEEGDHISLVPERDASEEPAAPGPTPTAGASLRALRAERPAASEPAAWSGHSGAREPQFQPRRPTTEPVIDANHWSQRRSSVDAPAAATHWSQRKPAQQLPWADLESTLETALQDDEPAADASSTQAAAAVEKLKRKSITGRIISRTLLAAVVLGLGIVGYGIVSGDIQFPWANKLKKLAQLVDNSAGDSKPTATASSQAVIFDSNPPNPSGSKGSGTAVWSVGSEPAGPQRAASTVLRFNLKIPERKINLAMVMRPEAAGSAMSHLIELRFLKDNGQPDPDVDNIASIVMTTAEQVEPRVLIGRVQKVAPGVFLFGLSGQASDRELNLRYLKEQTWFDIPLTYRNGASGVLAVEKGANGQQAVDDAVSQWERLAAEPADR